MNTNTNNPGRHDRAICVTVCFVFELVILFAFYA